MRGSVRGVLCRGQSALIDRIRLRPYLFIYWDVSMNERDVFASRQAACVEEEMKNAWTKTCRPYLDRVNIIKVQHSLFPPLYLTQCIR